MISKIDAALYDESVTTHNSFFKLFKTYFNTPGVFQKLLSWSFWNRHSNVSRITTSGSADGSREHMNCAT
jgi:hypothetical protein